MPTYPEALDEMLKHIADEVSDTVYPPGRSVQMSLAYYQIVLDHHRAIANLLYIKCYASAFSLARPMYEALVKGAWIGHVTTDDQAEQRYKQRKELDDIEKLTDQLLKADLSSVISAQLKNIKQKYWKVLSSLTHVGYAQVSRWLNPTGVAPAYEDAELNELSNFACFMALSAGLGMAHLGKNDRAINRLRSLLPADASGIA